MKIVACFLFVLMGSSTAYCQYVSRPSLKYHAAEDPLSNRPNYQILADQSVTNLLPADVPNHFDPNVFQIKEQTHDVAITDLQKRVGDLERDSTWIKGGAAGIVIGIGLLLAFFKTFWRGIFIVLLKDVRPDLTVTSTNSPPS